MSTTSTQDETSSHVDEFSLSLSPPWDDLAPSPTIHAPSLSPHHHMDAGSLWEDHTRVTPLEHLIGQLESIFQFKTEKEKEKEKEETNSSPSSPLTHSPPHAPLADFSLTFRGIPYTLGYVVKSATAHERPEWESMILENPFTQTLLSIPNQILTPSDFCRAAHHWTLEAIGKGPIDKETSKWLLSAMRLASYRQQQPQASSSNEETFFVSSKNSILGINLSTTTLYEYASHRKEWQKTESMATNYQRLSREPESGLEFEQEETCSPYLDSLLHEAAAMASCLYESDDHLLYEVDSIYTRVNTSLLLEDLYRLHPQYYILHVQRKRSESHTLRLSAFLRLLNEPLDPQFKAFMKQHRPKGKSKWLADRMSSFRLPLVNTTLTQHLKDCQAYIPIESRLYAWMESMLALFLFNTVDRDPKEILLLEWQAFLESGLLDASDTNANSAASIDSSNATAPWPSGTCFLAQKTEHLRKLNKMIHAYEAQDLNSEAKLKFLHEMDAKKSFLTDWRKELMDRLESMRKPEPKTAATLLQNEKDPTNASSDKEATDSDSTSSDSDSVFYDSRMELLDLDLMAEMPLHAPSSVSSPPLAVQAADADADSTSDPSSPHSSLSPSFSPSSFSPRSPHSSSLPPPPPVGVHGLLLDAQGRPIASQSDPSQSIQVPETLLFPSGHEKRQLSSDMSAFKAANHPAVDFVDFLLWYSPRDCQLNPATACYEPSGRMSATGNIWQSLWMAAVRQPAVEQSDWHLSQRLEKEKTLEQLRELDLDELLLQWIPTFYSLAYEYFSDWAATFSLSADRAPALKGLENVLALFPWRSLDSAGMSGLEAPLEWCLKAGSLLTFLSSLPEPFQAESQLDVALKLERGENFLLHAEHALYPAVQAFQSHYRLRDQTWMVGLKGKRENDMGHEFIYIEKRKGQAGGLLEIKTLE